MRDALPDDWEAQVERAYETFGIEPDAAEFGRLWQRIKGRAIGHVQHAPGIPRLMIDFERLHPRDEIGRWEQKRRASRSGGDRGSGLRRSWSQRGADAPGRERGTDGRAPGRPAGRREREALVEPRPLRYSPEALWELHEPEQPSTDFREVEQRRRSSQESVPYDGNRPGRVFEDAEGWQIQQPGSFLVDRGGQRWTARAPDGSVIGYFGSASEAEEAIEEARRGHR
jgi:hypothetical protein